MMDPDTLSTAIRLNVSELRAVLFQIDEDAMHRPPRIDAVRMHRVDELSKQLISVMQENKP
jgi:hypothetical protein